MSKDSANNPWETLTVKTVYENNWIEVTHHEVLNPAGGDGIYGVVNYKNLAIGILPIDDDLNTWLVGQYRYPMREYTWEIPEGGGPIGTDPLSAAKRELKEETGLSAKSWQKLLETQLSNSVSNERGVAFLARNLSSGEAAPEDTEELFVKKLPFEEAVDLVMLGEITDALSVMAIMKASIMIKSGELR